MDDHIMVIAVVIPPPRSVEERFWAKVICEVSTGCWLWTASLDSHGYGQFHLDGRTQRAHRVAYRLLNGVDAPGDIDHKHTKRCVRPEPGHCEPVTHRENTRRGVGWAGRNARVTHCPSGHEYTEENTYIDRNGNRHGCRTCKREYQRTYVQTHRH
jgi:hypothetical protein